MFEKASMVSRRKVLGILALFFLFSLWLPVRSQDGNQTSFASFAYFIDKLKFPLKKVGQIWATPRSVYEGPFHTNDELHIFLPPNYFEEMHLPFFRGPVSTSGTSIVYYKGYGPKDVAGQNDPKRFRMIFGGEVKTGVPTIPLPDYPGQTAKEGALAGIPLEKIPQGSLLFLPHDSNNHLTGGIVVKGNLDRLTFSVDSNHNEVIRLEADKKITTVEVAFGQGKTYVIDASEKTTPYDGIPNGAIYVSGDLGKRGQESGVSGKVKGQWTVSSDGDIFIPDSLLYSDTSAGSQPTGTDTLALIGRNVFVTKEAPEMLFLYATIFAGKKEGKEMSGTFFVLPNSDSPHNGQLIWWGNYIGAYPAIMGRFEQATGDSKDGYDLHKFYDARLAKNPPPFFPTLNQANVSTK